MLNANATKICPKIASIIGQSLFLSTCIWFNPIHLLFIPDYAIICCSVYALVIKCFEFNIWYPVDNIHYCTSRSKIDCHCKQYHDTIVCRLTYFLKRWVTMFLQLQCYVETSRLLLHRLDSYILTVYYNNNIKIFKWLCVLLGLIIFSYRLECTDSRERIVKGNKRARKKIGEGIL